MFIIQSRVYTYVKTHCMIYFKQLIYSVLYFSYNLSKAVKKSLSVLEASCWMLSEERTLKSGLWMLVRKLSYQTPR